MTTPGPTHDPAPRGAISCPKCCSPMKAVEVGPVTLDRCYACSALWLDTLERDRLLEHPSVARRADAPRGAAPHAAARGLLTCPRDRSRMIQIVDPRQPHVAFESCTVCGGCLLDAGELSDLSELTLRERLTRLFR